MMSLIYCDCFSGISGDMFLAASLDAGLPVPALDEQFLRLKLPEYHGVSVKKVHQGAIYASSVLLDFDETQMESAASAGTGVPLPEEPHKDLAHHHHPHGHQRSWQQIRDLIQSSEISSGVKERSTQIFSLLAEAEAKIHGVSTEEVHFHEVGAVDSILDIVGAAFALEYFDIHEIYSSPVPVSSGAVETQHGLLPLPAPATLELLKRAQAHLIPSRTDRELVTPTGAAILASGAIFTQPNFTIKNVGIGAGKQTLEWPNIFRLMIGDQEMPGQTHIELETNIDDMNPQIYGTILSRLFSIGALDVFFTPIIMKKNRPGTRISVIAREEDEDRISDLLLNETSTMGVRVKTIHRHEAQREMRSVETQWGKVPVKLKIIKGRTMGAAPEYDRCAEIAANAGVPVLLVYEAASAAAFQLVDQETGIQPDK